MFFMTKPWSTHLLELATLLIFCNRQQEWANETQFIWKLLTISSVNLIKRLRKFNDCSEVFPRVLFDNN